MVSLVLLAIPFTAGAQEQETDLDIEALAAKLVPCVYEWECFDVFDFEKEIELVQLFGLKCPEAESGIGKVTLGGHSGLEQSGYFNIEGLAFAWRFGESESGYYDYLFSIRPDGTGLYYDFSNSEVGETIQPSERFDCVDRTAGAANRLLDIPEDSDAKE